MSDEIDELKKQIAELKAEKEKASPLLAAVTILGLVGAAVACASVDQKERDSRRRNRSLLERII